jgi:hypothetical protein
VEKERREENQREGEREKRIVLNINKWLKGPF